MTCFVAYDKLTCNFPSIQDEYTPLHHAISGLATDETCLKMVELLIEFQADTVQVTKVRFFLDYYHAHPVICDDCCACVQ
jgi:hypothetical protein